MGKMGKYIYGIIPSISVNQNLYPVPQMINSEENKISIPEKIYTISYQDISALVSNSEKVDYIKLPKDILARYLLIHQKVIEKIMSEYSIIPVRMGTFAEDEDEVKNILKKGYSLITETMGNIKDKIEIDVVAIWNDFDSVIKETGEEKKIREFKERLLSNSREITVDNQMMVGVMVKKALDKKREIYAQKIQNDLRTISQDFKVHELMDDRMVVNSAFLIQKSEQNKFYRKVEELNTVFNEKLNFRCVGPLPAYSFYTLEIKKMQFEEISWARKKLGLNDVASKDEIKKAYRARAASFHPDKNPDTQPVMKKEFNDVCRAYKIIADYCLAEELESQLDNYSFTEHQSKKKTILVKMM